MASTKEYLEYVVEQLLAAGFVDVRSRSMMGEYLLYMDGVLIGGIYDDRFLLKKVEGNEGFGMEEAIPYPGARPMWLVGEVDDKEKLKEVVRAITKVEMREKYGVVGIKFRLCEYEKSRG